MSGARALLAWLGLARPAANDASIGGMLKDAYHANLQATLRSPVAAWRDWRALNDLRATMRELADQLPCQEGVPALHFVYGLKQVEEFPFYAYVAVISAQAHHPNAKTFFFIGYEPVGRFWELLKPRIHLVKVPNFNWFGVAKVHHYAHKADMIRLMAICEIGGLYLDCDTITLASMDELAVHNFVLGVQQTIPGAMGGFCNAIMLCKRNSSFARYWLNTYRSFNSKGRDLHWDFHSVKLPMYLYSKQTDDVHVLKHDKWFFPLWNHIYGFMFATDNLAPKRELLQGQYAIHLWHNMVAETLDAWSPGRMIIEPCLYAELCLKAFALLPELERAQVFAGLGIDNVPRMTLEVVA